MAAALAPEFAWAARSIPLDQIDSTMIYWGNPGSFEKAAAADFESILHATPEFEEILEKRVERGSGKYWILYGRAHDRVIKALSDVGRSTEYDLVGELSYMARLDPPVPFDDITSLVVEKVGGE